MPLLELDQSKVLTAADLRLLNRKLAAIDSGFRKQMAKDAKQVGREAESIIKSALPTSSPFGASNSRGRLAWNHQVNAKGRSLANNATGVAFKTSGSRRSAVTSLVSVKVLAPATVIADIAGRSGRYIDRGFRGSGMTRMYSRNGLMMRHTLNGQGEAMIRKLNSSGGRPSRYAWPAIESHRPRLEAEVRHIIEKYIQIANRGL